MNPSLDPDCYRVVLTLSWTPIVTLTLTLTLILTLSNQKFFWNWIDGAFGWSRQAAFLENPIGPGSRPWSGAGAGVNVEQVETGAIGGSSSLGAGAAGAETEAGAGAMGGGTSVGAWAEPEVEAELGVGPMSGARSSSPDEPAAGDQDVEVVV